MKNALLVLSIVAASLALLMAVPILLCGGCFVAVLNTPSPAANYRPPKAEPTKKPKQHDSTNVDWNVTTMTDTTFVARNRESLNRLVKLQAVGDKDGIALLMLDGELFVIEKYRQVRVIDRGFSTSEIRVMNGPEKGRSGYVLSDFLK